MKRHHKTEHPWQAIVSRSYLPKSEHIYHARYIFVGAHRLSSKVICKVWYAFRQRQPSNQRSMSKRSRLWHVLNAGLSHTPHTPHTPHTIPIDASGDKRTRDERDEERDERDDELDGELDGELDDDTLSENLSTSSDETHLAPEDLEIILSRMRLTMSITPTWRVEHRDFSHNFDHSNTPLVRYDRNWDLPELRLSNATTREVALTGTLDLILFKLMDGSYGEDDDSPTEPPLLNRQHYYVHLNACLNAMTLRPELLDNMDSKFRRYIQENTSTMLSLIFIYNAISNESGKTSIISVDELMEQGLSELDIYRFWHQVRALLSDLMESTAVSMAVSGRPLRVGEFVQTMVFEIDPRVPVLSYSSQPMDW